jgi:hypothetical protein
MMKRTIAVIVGVLAGVVVIALIQSLSHLIYPLPAGVDVNDTEAMKQVISTLPVGAFLFVLLSYAVGSFSGGLVSALIFKPGKYLDSVLIGSILMIMGLFTLLNIPHPLWFWIASLFIYLPMSLLGAKIRK